MSFAKTKVSNSSLRPNEYANVLNHVSDRLSHLPSHWQTQKFRTTAKAIKYSVQITVAVIIPSQATTSFWFNALVSDENLRRSPQRKIVTQRDTESNSYTQRCTISKTIFARSRTTLPRSGLSVYSRNLFLGGRESPQKTYNPSNRCQIVCSKSFFVGKMNYKYVTETFF